MKKNIKAIVDELGLASASEIESVLKELMGEVKKRTLFSNLKSMEEDKTIFKVLAGESSYGVEGYIKGPNLESEDDFEVKRIIVERGLPTRDVEEIDWGLFSSRVLDELMNELKILQEDLNGTYDDPKNIEMRYFDLSIWYHELHRFFFDVYDTGFLAQAEALLNDCKSVIDRMDI